MKTKHWIVLFAGLAAACLAAIVLFPLPNRRQTVPSYIKTGP